MPHTLLTRGGPGAGAAVVEAGGDRSRSGTIAHALELAARLQGSVPVLNRCRDRYAFLVSWLASQIANRTMLLWPEDLSIDNLPRAYRDHITIDESLVAETVAEADRTAELQPSLGNTVVFTSGSTGAPVGHVKSAAELRAVADILAAAVPPPRRESGTIVSTVPSWHMYGLEWNVLLPAATGLAIASSASFFPKDIATALERIDGPRLLITTPVHLRAVADALIPLPAIDLVVSATAPLDLDLARRCADAWNAEILEIYGCTEAGTLARRFPLGEDHWTLLPGFCAEASGSQVSVSAAHLKAPVPLQDHIELLGEGRFRLGKRLGDLVKVGGKRESLSALTGKLLNIPGVRDAAFDFDESNARLRAAVVARNLTAEQIRNALRRQIDPVFLPRPLKLVEALPRTPAGKLRRSALQKVFNP